MSPTTLPQYVLTCAALVAITGAASIGQAQSCSTTAESLSPCTVSVTAASNGTTSVTMVFRNNTIELDDIGLTCSVSGVVASCLVPSDLPVPSHTSKSFVVKVTGGPIGGPGTVRVMSSGILELAATISVTVNGPSPCLAVDDTSSLLLTSLRAVGTATAGGRAIQRTNAKVPLLSSASQVQQVASGGACNSAANAFSAAFISADSTRKPTPFRRVYLYQFGTMWAVGDPNVRAGEFFPVMVFNSSFTYVSTLLQ